MADLVQSTTEDAPAPIGHPSAERGALIRIWDIVHTPTSATNYRTGERHFMADFDAIRAIIKPFMSNRNG